MQPGETIKPGGSAEPATAPAPSQEPETTAPATADAPEISWTASEYVAHQKTTNWYVMLGLGSAGLATLTYLLTGDVISTAAIVIVGVIFGMAASRQPRTLAYGIDHGGIMIGEKFYPYADFKSFSVMEEDAIYSILLLPMKRFMPSVSIYYPPDQEDDIMAVLSTYLPHEARAVDMVDRLARKLRF